MSAINYLDEAGASRKHLMSEPAIRLAIYLPVLTAQIPGVIYITCPQDTTANLVSTQVATAAIEDQERVASRRTHFIVENMLRAISYHTPFLSTSRRAHSLAKSFSRPSVCYLRQTLAVPILCFCSSRPRGRCVHSSLRCHWPMSCIKDPGRYTPYLISRQRKCPKRPFHAILLQTAVEPHTRMNGLLRTRSFIDICLAVDHHFLLLSS